MDESGCQGLDLTLSGTSKYFLMTFLLTNNKRALDKIVKKVYKGLSKTDKKHHARKSGILHAYYEDSITKKRLLNHLINTNINIMTIRLDKRKLFIPMEQTFLYTLMANTLLNKCITNKTLSHNEPISFIASKLYTKNKHTQDFINSLENNSLLDIKVDVKSPYEDKGLQAVDFISWSIYQKYENNNDEFINIINEKIIENYELFK